MENLEIIKIGFSNKLSRGSFKPIFHFKFHLKLLKY